MNAEGEYRDGGGCCDIGCFFAGKSGIKCVNKFRCCNIDIQGAIAIAP